MELNEYAIILSVLSILGFTLGFLSVIIAVISLVKVIAMEKSTHTITYQPVDEEIDAHNERFLKSEEETWATTEASLVKQQSEYKEQLESDLPEFSDSDEDKIIHSF